MEKFNNTAIDNEERYSLSNHEYSETTPPLAEMPKFTEQMIADFREYFLDNGYSETPPVKITSGVDETVRFVGSHISPMKEYFLNENIPEDGMIMSQPCVRTRNYPKLLDDTFVPAWGSYFKSLGVLVRPEKIEELCDQSIEYLLSVVKIPRENLTLRVNKEDTDLYNLADKYRSLDIGYDDSSMPEKYYRHKLGVEGVWGRNFNYAINANGTLHDIGNLIILENAEKQFGVELALGTSTILKHYFNLPHVNSANPVPDIENLDSPLRFKFEDSMITSAVLLSEGLRPSASDNKERILRSYLRGIIYFKNKLDIPSDAVVQMMHEFESSQNLNHEGSDFIKDYIPSAEQSLLSQKDTSPEEQKLLEVLRSK